ncbi:hypothetical protein GGU10DRAFT_366608 [Lentinula aff. detonsa]|uniref:Uncharacterized protein n=1 Tax=Lentinula aff. detonsa TaxID=2804958 RepID=A0AA38NJG5_9AGAR|nr:hypothetical protein GGU10DRAFT_366608 [Lentinula aff. detonsa]
MNGRNESGNSDNNDTLGLREQEIDMEGVQRTYLHRADDYTINSLNSFSFGNATTAKPQVDVVVSSDGTGETGNKVGEELGEISPTVTTVDVTPRPSVAHTHSDALLYPYRRPPLPSSSSASSSEPDSEPNLHSSSSTSATTSTSVSQATRTSRTIPALNRREDVEFSSDDDSYEFDNFDYPEGDDGRDNTEISSARFSMTSGNTGNDYNGDYASHGPSEGYRDREGSVATLRIRSSDRDNSPPIFTSPFASASVSATAATSSSVPPASTSTHSHTVGSIPTSPSTGTTFSGMDTDFDFAYITSFGADLSSDPSSSVPDFVRPRRPSALSLSGAPLNRETSSRKDSLGKSLFFSWLSGRRPSTATVASSNSSNMFVHDDSFARNLLKWGGEGYKEQRKDWTIRREVHTGSSSLISLTTSSPNKEEKLKRVTTTSTAPRMSTATNITAATSTDVGPFHNSHNSLVLEQASSHYEKELSHSHTKSQSHDNLKDKDTKSDYSHKEREKERLRRSTMHWRGMPIGSDEVWGNDLLGKFTVIREEVGRGAKAQDPTKGPQQRLLIRFRADSQPTPKAAEQYPHPPVTVHKHSKAMAFSLTRYYKPSSVPSSSAAMRSKSTTPSVGLVTSHAHIPPRLKSTGVVGSGNPSVSLLPRANSNRIILLAPRRVQEAFTSTTTTKMLADHGLLSPGPSSVNRTERDMARDRGGEWVKKSLPSDGASTFRSSPSPEKMRRKKSLSAAQPQLQSSTSSSPPPVPPLPTTSNSPLSSSPTAALTPPNSSSLGIPAMYSQSSPIDAPFDSSEVSSFSSASVTSSTILSSTTALASSPASVSQRMSSCTTSTDNTEQTDRSSTLVDSEPSEMSSASASEASASESSAGSSRPPHRLRVPRRKWYEHEHNEDETDQSSYNDDDDDDLYGYRSHRDGGPSRVIRTPHNETYGTVDFSSADDRQRVLQLVSESSPSSSSPFSILRFINRNVRTGVIDSLDPSASALRATAGPAFDPPWLTFPSRGKQEQQRRVVDNLNMSFKDVGLLPSTPRESHGRYGSNSVGRSTISTVTGSGRRKSINGGGKTKKDKSTASRASDPSRDVFASVPPESLCMLLPLWPGDTDPPSQAHSQHIYPPSQSPFRKPVVPLEKRSFLLVWYKALEPQIPTSKGGKDGSRKGGNDQNKEEVALAVIDSLIGLSPDTEKGKGKDKKDKQSRSNATGSGKDSGKDSGKSSRTSPTSSSDSTGFLRSSRSLGGLGIGSSSGRGSGTSATASGTHPHSNFTWAQVHANDERNILLPGFLITARRVSYRDLQGTGVRVPDEGVTVNGPLEEAWRECFNIPESMSGVTIDPGTPLNSSFMPDPTILAVCHSRESGVEFDPEALISLGLCRVLNPLPMGMVAEDFVESRVSGEESQDGWGFGGVELKLKLTPVGKAIMEMCWVGGLALTSFGPS